MSETTTTQKTQHLFHFTDANFQAEVMESELPVLVDFWASWCAPCRMLAPMIEELAGQYEGSVKVGKLDVDANPEAARAHGIRSIPSVLIFKDGEVVNTLVGVQPKPLYEQELEQVIPIG